MAQDAAPGKRPAAGRTCENWQGAPESGAMNWTITTDERISVAEMAALMHAFQLNAEHRPDRGAVVFTPAAPHVPRPSVEAIAEVMQRRAPFPASYQIRKVA